VTQKNPSPDSLRRAIVEFVRDYSIEATTHDVGKINELQEVIPAGKCVYIAHLPGVPLEDVVAFAGKLRERGWVPVPHIVSRRLQSRAQLDKTLADLKALKVDQALVIAGDQAVEKPAFNSSLEVLQTGLFEQYEFRTIGVAGHPEGSAAIGAERVEAALRGKVAYAKSSGLDLYFATQFGFDPEAFVRWEAHTTAEGITQPIHAGMPGPASMRQLMKFAMVCGIGASARMLTTRTSAMANLLRTQAPDDQLTFIARHRAANPGSRLVKPHFFAFGGVVKTARWANAVVAGRFALNAEADGFRVEEN
jgi:methylenetetrahydrofolate reductase (NADPH)